MRSPLDRRLMLMDWTAHGPRQATCCCGREFRYVNGWDEYSPDEDGVSEVCWAMQSARTGRPLGGWGDCVPICSPQCPRTPSSTVAGTLDERFYEADQVAEDGWWFDLEESWRGTCPGVGGYPESVIREEARDVWEDRVQLMFFAVWSWGGEGEGEAAAGE